MSPVSFEHAPYIYRIDYGHFFSIIVRL